MHRKLLYTLLVILVSWLPPGPAQAQDPPESLNIVLVIDDSGSMADNDKQGLRLVAAKLFVSLLEPQDQVAVVRFTAQSQVVAPFTPMDPKSKRELMAALDANFHSYGETDIQAALAHSKTLMAEAPAGRGQVVFLTDGLPSIPGWQSHQPTLDDLNTYVEETLAIAQEIGNPVLTVGLGDEVDREFLRAISRVSGGHYFEATTALDLPAVYLEMLSELQDRTVVGPGPLSAPGETAVEVHRYARSVGFVVVKDPSLTAALYPPGAVQPLDPAASGLIAFAEPQFDVVVVPDLPPGPWRVAMDGTGQANVKAIIIRSRLQLDLLGPSQAEACSGQPWLVSARLSLVDDQGKLDPLTGAGVPRDLNAEITLPDGQAETLVLQDEAGSGVFTAFFSTTRQPGTYQIVLKTDANGLGVRRTAQITGRACPGLAIVAPQDGDTLDLAPDEPVAVEARLVAEGGQPLDAGGVVALVTDATGHQVQLRLTDAGRGHYRGEYVPQGSGPIEVRARLEDAVWRGLPVQAEAEPAHLAINLIPPDPWERYRKLGRAAAAIAIILALLMLLRRMRQPRLDGELTYGPPGKRPDYTPVKGRSAYFRVEDGYLVVGSGRRRAQGMLRAEPNGGVRLLPLNSAQVTKNHLPVPREGSLLGPRDVIRLERLEVRYQNYGEE